MQWIAWSMRVWTGYFFSFLWWVHEIVRENATWKQGKTALEGLGSQGWQGNRPGHKLYPVGHVPQLLERVSWRWWPGSDPALWLPGWAVVLRQLWAQTVSRIGKTPGRWGQSCSAALAQGPGVRIRAKMELKPIEETLSWQGFLQLFLSHLCLCCSSWCALWTRVV